MRFIEHFHGRVTKTLLVSCKLTLLSKSMRTQSNPALIPDSPSLFWKFYPFMETF